MRGGAESGFRRVEPTKYEPRLLHFHGDKNQIEVKEVIVDRGSYMSAHVLLNLLKELWKRNKMRGKSLFATRLINSIIQEHEC